MLVVGTCRGVFLLHGKEQPLDPAESPVISISTGLGLSEWVEVGDSNGSKSANRPSLPCLL